jgi:hypothetical protein
MNTEINFWFQGKGIYVAAAKEFISPSNCMFRSDTPSSVLLVYPSIRLFSLFTLMFVLIKHVINFVPENLLKLVDKFECRLEINVEIGGDWEASSFVIPTVPRNSFHCFDTRGQSDHSKTTCISEHFMSRFVWTFGVNR